MALFCQPPCLIQIGPYMRGPGRLHLFNCISSILHKSTTQQGKWREGKLKITNCWEKERKRETQESRLTASQRCVTEQHFHTGKNVIIERAGMGSAIEDILCISVTLEQCGSFKR